MQLLFGIAADGRTYPDAPAPSGGVDMAIVGPAGLIDLLEIQLGLAGPAYPRAVRIAAYLAKLRLVDDPRFWQKSLARDPWSTAAELLSWRDDLIAAGWNRDPVGAPRVDDIAAVESAGPPLPPGLAERATDILALLPDRAGLRLARLDLLEPRVSLPALWARLIDALEAAGVAVHVHDGRRAGPTGSDLGRVQQALGGTASEPLEGDGSFVLIEADTALMAAEAVADWLAAGPPEALEGTVVLAPDGDTALLDRSLGARGLPALGLSSSSPWRGALQVLPLAFAVAWRPFNPQAMLNLLMLERPPLPRFAAARLVRALTEQPGLDGVAWNQAWEDIAARALVMNADSGSRAQAKTEAQLTRWKAWTSGALFERLPGMPADEVRKIAGRVAAWAMEVDAGAGDPLLLAVAQAAVALSQSVDQLKQEFLPALLLDRIIGQVLADGVQNPTHWPEAGGLRAVRAPTALWDGAPRVIWWNFVGPGEKGPMQPWSRAELASLETAGIVLEPADAVSRRIALSSAEVVHRASEHLLLVRPALSRSDKTVTHPLAHQLRPILTGAAAEVRFRAERLLREPAATLAGRVLARQARETLSPPTGRATWPLPTGAIARLEGRQESASSMGRLVNCQLAWLTRDVFGLRAGTAAELPRADKLFGNLAHEIASRLLQPGPPPPAEGIRAAAAELFETLLPQIAAPLQQPQFAGELAAARTLVPAALEALVRLLHERNLEVVGTELEREGAAGELLLHGRLDLLVRREARVAVLDLKWTHSERRYREEIRDGRAIQLAVYRGIAGPEGDMGDGGYFLLRQRRVLAPEGSILADDPLEASRGQAETLHMLAADWGTWRVLAGSGVVLAAGVEGAVGHRPAGLGFDAAAEPCRYCEFTGLCRIHVEPL